MLDSIMAFIAVGFAAQMVDGALGMAYGVLATSILLAQGLTPAVASASVHAAETFTTAASGASHWRLGNVDKKLLWRLAGPGVIGGVLCAVVLTSFPGDKIRPFVALYLLFAGVIVLVRGLNGSHHAQMLGSHALMACGFVAGFRRLACCVGRVGDGCAWRSLALAVVFDGVKQAAAKCDDADGDEADEFHRALGDALFERGPGGER